MESAIQLLQRKFRKAKSSAKPNVLNSRSQTSASVVIARPAIDTRLTLFKECTITKERKLLFDSSHRQLKNDNTTSHAQRCLSDWNKIVETVFGSVGINRKSSSVLKIHELNGSELMISYVFSTTHDDLKNASYSLDRGMEKHNLKMSQNNTSRRKASTMPAPLSSDQLSKSSNNSLVFDQDIDRSDSILSLTNFLSKSFQGSIRSTNSGKTSPCYSSCESPSSEEASISGGGDCVKSKQISGKRKNFRLAFGLICQPEPNDASSFKKFFYDHFPLFENHIKQMKKSIEDVIANSWRVNPHFFNDINKALDRLTLRFNNLYATPRLPEMVWSKLTWQPLPSEERTIVKNCFIGDLSRLILNFENKTVNKQRFNFTCSLITAVLTHHLGWVSSIALSQPLSNNHDDDYADDDDDDGDSDDDTRITGEEDNVGQEVEMYNSLWAQLRDIYGAVNYPTKTCKTVVTGSNHEIVSTVLAILSYFIRSARVDETVRAPDIITPESFERSPPSYGDQLIDSLSLSLVQSEIEPESDYVLVSFNEDDNTATTHITTNQPRNLSPPRPRSHAFIKDNNGSPRKQSEPLSLGVFSQLRRSRRKSFYNNTNRHHQQHLNTNQPSTSQMSISPNQTLESLTTSSSTSCASSCNDHFIPPSSSPSNPQQLTRQRHRTEHQNEENFIRKGSPSSEDDDGEFIEFARRRMSSSAPEIRISCDFNDEEEAEGDLVLPPSYESCCDDVMLLNHQQPDSSHHSDDDSNGLGRRKRRRGYEEVPLDEVLALESPLLTDDLISHDSSDYATGFSSLMADYNPCFLNDFVLQGVAKTPEQIRDDIVTDLRETTRSKSTILDDDIDESCCIIADSDSWSVKIMSSKRADSDRMALPSIQSRLVHNLLLQIANMYQMKIEPSFCLEHLENSLRVIAMKSRTLARYVKGKGRRITASQLSTALSIDKLDIPLLMAASSCHLSFGGGSGKSDLL